MELLENILIMAFHFRRLSSKTDFYRERPKILKKALLLPWVIFFIYTLAYTKKN